MEVRYAKQEDYPKFEKLHGQFFYAGFIDQRRKITVPKEVFDKLVATESLFLAFKQNELIGYSVMQGYTDGACKIEEIFISPDYQRRGYGFAFIMKIKEQAKKEGFTKIELMSATYESDRFWEKCRFVSKDGTDLYEINL